MLGYVFVLQKNYEINKTQTFHKTYINIGTVKCIYKMRKEVNMMNRNDQDFLVQKIRTQYTEKEHTGLDELKELDSKVKRPANIFSYIFGSISVIIMGSGMSLVMTDISKTVGIGNPMLYGIIIGIVGMFMAIINYPIYKGILGTRRKKYADKIIALSDEIMKG